jgi:multidrug transporter EmrE-like cation transporter
MNPQYPVADPEAHEARVHDPDHERKSNAMLIGLILLSVCLAALAQLTLKHGMNQVTAANGTAQLNASSLKAIVTTPSVIGGLAIFGISAFVWLLVLSRASLSFAYPFASLTYLLIVLADQFVLHEQVPPLRWAGVFFIMVGIVLVAQTPHTSA